MTSVYTIPKKLDRKGFEQIEAGGGLYWLPCSLLIGLRKAGILEIQPWPIVPDHMVTGKSPALWLTSPSCHGWTLLANCVPAPELEQEEEQDEPAGTYGGWKLTQRCANGGFKDITSGYRSKRDTYDLIWAYIEGLRTAQEGQNAAKI